MMPAEPISKSVRVMESLMKSSVAKPMETVAEMPIEGIAAKPEAKASAEVPSIETVAVEIESGFKAMLKETGSVSTY